MATTVCRNSTFSCTRVIGESRNKPEFKYLHSQNSTLMKTGDRVSHGTIKLDLSSMSNKSFRLERIQDSMWGRAPSCLKVTTRNACLFCSRHSVGLQKHKRTHCSDYKFFLPDTHRTRLLNKE
ncbi:hypothetical protein TNCT_118681 [Trichonephila clavata]|uniref:Uncharacterized protein n=1 Tax=Trichonephila clavata TaxID=2740835 RepID=A0A8X6KXS3_TRICU|nr:hypothetical protein TNCT_118681 [Trichonephila clavata]